ncbi:transporter substrate-binding domain-containing protein [Eubacteriales bacterium OttesenSCG-928-A19]|nr:transporter substrate-binding domain-containing protein [Eubacteriales bacterium OttesenSCG-928-A19]
MKRLFTVALAMMLVLTMAGSALAANRLEEVLAAGKIVMATSPDFAPSEFIDPNKTGQESIVGADVSLGKYIAENLGVELVIDSMEFSAVLGAVTTGKVDIAISGLTYLPERAEAMEMSTPYNLNKADDGQGLLVAVGTGDAFATPEDFVGKKVAVQNGSLQHKLLTEQLPGAQAEMITNLNDAVMMLITGKVDAVGVAGGNGKAYMNNYDEIEMAAFYYDFSAEGTSVAAPKGETELIEAINEIIAKAEAEEGMMQGWYDDAVALAESLGIE